ncbi:MAG TPA: hypothetical protein EYQ50_17615 [Verrucomicrobiales bacterium]|nr:hypothetical protein [Verrucomicrobiales bacterium]HIL68299.1 hypothetical protein [Verrucomicrobiota bacterium]
MKTDCRDKKIKSFWKGKSGVMTHGMKRGIWVNSGIIFWLLSFNISLIAADFQGSHHIFEYEKAPIAYSRTEAGDPVARFSKDLESGNQELAFDLKFGYLPDILKKLDILPESQVLVFSKSSLQRDLISPTSPRAIYFNDDVYIGWVRWSGSLEISTADPELGGVFYVLPQEKQRVPAIARKNSCLECHVSSKSMGVPGHLFRSFRTTVQGELYQTIGGESMNHNTLLIDRFGGWYVSGSHKGQPHLGNVFGKQRYLNWDEDPMTYGNQSGLTEFFDSSQYYRDSSDMVALMVLSHQIHMHNFLTRLSFETRKNLSAYGHIRYVHPIAEAFLQYLLFAGEPLLEGEIRGGTRFETEFAKRPPFDSRGRSLREFNLKTRLFKYPCSYLVYSDSFRKLPGEIKDFVYFRLWEILSGKDTSEPYREISKYIKRAILEILEDTVKNLPEYWNSSLLPDI